MSEEQLQDKLSFLPSDEASAYPAWLHSLNELTSKAPTGGVDGSDVGDRCFSLSTGRVIFGLCLAELPDSFMIGLPALLTSDGQSIRGKAFVAEPVMRLFKSNILFSCITQPDHKFFYYEYISECQDKMPGFFNLDRLETIGRMLLEGSTGAFSIPPLDEEDDDDDDQYKAQQHIYNKKTRH